MPSRIVAQVIMILAAIAWMCLWFAIDIAFFKWTFLITGALAFALDNRRYRARPALPLLSSHPRQ